MGSRMMHLIIANQVAAKLKVQNKQDFLLGGIAPDAVFTQDGKCKSHYYEGKLDDGTRFVNYQDFIEKYHFDIQNEYMLGYLTHIVSDDVWMKHVYFKKDLKNRLDSDPSLLARWHDDFRMLNGILVEKFDCGDLMNLLVETNIHINTVSEINTSDLKSFKEDTLNDFMYTKEDLEKELQVYSLNEIIRFIDLATLAAFNVCSAIKKNQVFK